MTNPLRIATRKSPLALWQADHVRERLMAIAPDRQVVLVPIVTEGDRRLEVALSRIGGKSLFVKELERAMLDGLADMAVHSMKDVAAELPDGLVIHHVLEREDPHDALVGANSLDSLAHGARIGTCSLRRRSQLLACRPDLVIGLLRGNVNTRLAKLDAGEHDAIVLAAAGLMRLELESRIGTRLSVELSLPAIGQGIIGIETRADDNTLHGLLQQMHHEPSALRLAAERRVSMRLDGGCSSPVAGHATLVDDRMSLVARVGSLDGTTMLEAAASIAMQGDMAATQSAAVQLGDTIADRLLADGARSVLAQAALDNDSA